MARFEKRPHTRERTSSSGAEHKRFPVGSRPNEISDETIERIRRENIERLKKFRT